MGKAKQLMRSLRSRLSSLKAQECASPPRSRDSRASSYSYAHLSSARLSSSPTTVGYDTHTPPTTVPTTPQTANQFEHEPGTTTTVCGMATWRSYKDDDDDDDCPLVAARVELAASQAMLNFARMLPLEELCIIGRGLEMSRSTVTETDQIIYTASVPSPPVLGKHRHGQSTCQETGTTAGDIQKLKSYSSHTLSVSSRSSASTWSFACRSARRIEREHRDGVDDDDASSFGSLSGWRVTYSDKTAGGESLKMCAMDFGMQEAQWSNASSWRSMSSSSPSRHESGIMAMSDAEFHALPDYSDIESDSAYDSPYSPGSDASSRACRW